MALPICCSFVGAYGVGFGSPDANGSGFLGGVQAGWNYQVGRLVVGGDYDLSATRLNGGTSGTIPGATLGSTGAATETFSTHTDWTATATSTLGWAFERWLAYTKAGVAFAHDTYSFGFVGSDGFAASSSDIRLGWTVGAGLSWAYDKNWSAKIEYDYLSFSNKSLDFTAPIGAFPITFNMNSSQAISQLKVGLNYKLTSGLLSSQTADARGTYGLGARPAVDWTGFYVGGHVGGGMQSSTFQDPGLTAAVSICCEPLGALSPGAIASNANGNGFLGGVQAGVNYQVNRLVVGAEADWTGTKLKGTSVGVIPPLGGGFPATETFSVRTNWTATATATLGIAFDRWLVYGKTGLALADDSYALGVNGNNYCYGPCTGEPFSFGSSARGIRTGWTVGTGVAWAYDNNWSVKAEYDYLSLPGKAVDFSGTIQNAVGGPPFGNPVTGVSTFNTNTSQNISQVKVGLNYKLAPNLLLDGPNVAATPRYAKAKPAATAVNWTGFFVGGHVGGSWQDTQFQDPSSTAALIECCSLVGAQTPGLAASNATGGSFLGGVQAGWNYQIRRLVVGFDADWTGMKLDGTSVGIFQPGTLAPGAVASETFGTRIEWTATATAKLGLAFDRWLVYGKGGLAVAHDSDTLALTGTNVVCCFGVGGGNFGYAAATSENRLGWTVGAGLAWAYDNNWSVKAEYDYLDFAAKPVDFTGAFQNAQRGGYGPLTSNATFNTNNSQHISELKLGIDYKIAPGPF